MLLYLVIVAFAAVAQAAKVTKHLTLSKTTTLTPMDFIPALFWV